MVEIGKLCGVTEAETIVAASSSDNSVVVMITSPLEQVFVDRIAAVDPSRVEVIFRPELLPPTRYLGDHTGSDDWTRTSAQAAEWLDLLAQAEVLLDFAPSTDRGPFDLSPGLRWVQTTSAGVGQLVKTLGVAQSDLIVTTASGVHSEALTEFVFAVLLYHE